MSGIELFGVDQVAPDLDIDDVENARQYLLDILVDGSGSMGGYVSAMQDALANFKLAIQGSKEVDEILAARTDFGVPGGIRVNGYQYIDQFPVGYGAHNSTPLYDAIVAAQQRLYRGDGQGYMERLAQNGVKVNAAIAIFSDGYDNDSRASASDAAAAVALLQKWEIKVAFVAFGKGAQGVAANLGIKEVREYDASERDLREIFALLSRSAISASQSAAAGQSQGAFFV
ncbi:MAG: hypothetical protein LBL84_01435 [Candidatus Nomurabacteria bacterium]|jgi:hypothetical protein|nr:hypothetical protein [Candidatus Nomurabacteria bacterium]